MRALRGWHWADVLPTLDKEHCGAPDGLARAPEIGCRTSCGGPGTFGAACAHRMMPCGAEVVVYLVPGPPGQALQAACRRTGPMMAEPSPGGNPRLGPLTRRSMGKTRPAGREKNLKWADLRQLRTSSPGAGPAPAAQRLAAPGCRRRTPHGRQSSSSLPPLRAPPCRR
jgi:hypothetical protein